MLRGALQHTKARGGVCHDENQYLAIVDWVLHNGRLEEGRNGRVRADTGAAMHFSLERGALPIFTTKHVAWRVCLRELLWFISGSTDVRVLAARGVRIWDGNGTRAFLDGRGLNNNREGDLGPVYGHQWRHFNAPYVGADADYSGEGVDQLQAIVDALADPAQRTSRRMVMCAWNPAQLSEMALPPCHLLAQFHVADGRKLSCSVYQRSGDLGLGVPFNIASYAFLTHLLAAHCGLEAYELVHHLGHCHVYEGHEAGLEEQLTRTPREFPRLRIAARPRGTDIGAYEEEDFAVDGYAPHPKITLPFRA
jgi:thymidylate synthase